MLSPIGKVEIQCVRWSGSCSSAPSPSSCAAHLQHDQINLIMVMITISHSLNIIYHHSYDINWWNYHSITIITITDIINSSTLWSWSKKYHDTGLSENRVPLNPLGDSVHQFITLFPHSMQGGARPVMFVDLYTIINVDIVVSWFINQLIYLLIDKL